MKKLNIVYEDKNIIVIDKPAGLLCISTENEKERTLFHYVYTYLKQKNKNNKVFIVHRLDKDTAGLIVFAKSEKDKTFLQTNWNQFKRKYVAVVEGIPPKNEDTIKSYIKETKTLVSYSSKQNDGKLAITKYRVLKRNKTNSLLEIEILTGRKNQIRVHLKELGNPIVGDDKYGTKVKSNLLLYANYLKIIHPKTKKEIFFERPIPSDFKKNFESIEK